MITAYEVLIVLNGLEPVDLNRLEFGVITEGTVTAVGTGRAAGRTVTLTEPSYFPFERGEVLVLDKESGREPFGEGRKPGKWAVTCECFAAFAEAMARRNAVLGEGGE